MSHVAEQRFIIVLGCDRCMQLPGRVFGPHSKGIKSQKEEPSCLKGITGKTARNASPSYYRKHMYFGTVMRKHGWEWHTLCALAARMLHSSCFANLSPPRAAVLLAAVARLETIDVPHLHLQLPVASVR